MMNSIFNIDISKIPEQLTYNASQPMIFNSGVFLWLFLIFVFVYMLLGKKTTLRLIFVTTFSYYFYYKSSGIYFFLLAVVTISDFLIAKAIYKVQQKHDEMGNFRNNKGKFTPLVSI